MKILKVFLVLLIFPLGAFAQDHNVDIKWNASPATVPACTTAYTYAVGRTTTPGNSSEAVIKSGITALTWNDSTVLNNTTYYYAVFASCGAKFGGYSAEVIAVVGGPPVVNPVAPPPPGGVGATVNNNVGATVNWNVVPNVDSYHVYVSNSAKRTWHFQASTTNLTFLDKTCKTKGVSCAYFLTSTKGQNESNPSLVAVVTPK